MVDSRNCVSRKGQVMKILQFEEAILEMLDIMWQYDAGPWPCDEKERFQAAKAKATQYIEFERFSVESDLSPEQLEIKNLEAERDALREELTSLRKTLENNA